MIKAIGLCRFEMGLSSESLELEEAFQVGVDGL